MVDITVTVRDISMEGAENIEAQFEEFINTTITINKPWPKMKFGDTFMYDGEEFAFLVYMNEDKVRAVAMDILINCAVIQPVYFDCSKRQSNVKFL